MIGIPRNLNTKRDVLNLQELAKENMINRKEWLARLEEMKAPDVFELPVLEKNENYFTLPKTERELPSQYKSKMELLKKSNENKEEEFLKIAGAAPEEGVVKIFVPSQEAEILGLTIEEIESMIKELV